MCCSVLQCVAVCCSVLQRHSRYNASQYIPDIERILRRYILEDIGVLQCVAVCYSVLQCVAVCCGMLQCVAVCCRVTVDTLMHSRHKT